MIWVVDASVAVKWYFNEPGSAAALRFLSEAEASDIQLAAPDLLFYEVGSVIHRRTKASQISRSEAIAFVHSLRQAPIHVVEPSVLLDGAMLAAQAIGAAFYDATYLVLARGLDAQVVTADDRLINACQDTEWSRYVRPLSFWNA